MRPAFVADGSVPVNASAAADNRGSRAKGLVNELIHDAAGNQASLITYLK
jgi:hypothetical protein